MLRKTMVSFLGSRWNVTSAYRGVQKFSNLAANSEKDFMHPEFYHSARPPLGKAITLPSEIYRSNKFYSLEQARVFDNSWVPVGYASHVQAPGQVFEGKVGGKSVIVTRDEDGDLHAFHNCCRHRANQILNDDERRSDLEHLRCSYHGWAYNLAGKLKKTPFFKDGQMNRDTHGLYSTPNVAVNEFLVFVNLDGSQVPLPEWLGDLSDRLKNYELNDWRVVREGKYRVEANWKLPIDNFNDFGHLQWVHPALRSLSKITNHEAYQGPGMYSGFRTRPITVKKEQGLVTLPPVPGLNSEEQVSAFFINYFPNIAVFLFSNHAYVLKVQPDGAQKCVEKIALLVPPQVSSHPDADRLIQQSWDYLTQVNNEDIDIVNRVQKGLQSEAFQGGPLSSYYEAAVWRFQNILADKMLGNRRIPKADENWEEAPDSVLLESEIKTLPEVGKLPSVRLARDRFFSPVEKIDSQTSQLELPQTTSSPTLRV